MDAKNRRETRRIELVETGNIINSIRRIKGAPSGNEEAVARAFYHAMCETYLFNNAARATIRQAMNLP